MLMTKKKTNSKVNQPLSWVRAHKIQTFFLVGLVVFAGIFSYSKYLDYRNVKDMEQLLTDFEKLEKAVETDTGKDLTIEANCSSGGKFATSYSCSLYLKNEEKELYSYESFINENSALNIDKNRCRVITSRDASYLNFFACTISVNTSNKTKAKSIFSQFETSTSPSTNQ